MVKHVGILFLTFILAGCWWKKPIDPEVKLNTSFESIPETHKIAAGIVDEASGIAPCLTDKGNFWIIEDSQSPNYLTMVNSKAEFIKKIEMPFSNYDWEDLAAGPGPISGQNYLYVGDIGDNFFNRPTYKIYRLPEPKDASVTYSTISYVYPDNKHFDAEAMVVDPATKDVFIFTKENNTCQVFKLGFPQTTDQVMIAQKVADVSFVFATSAAMSPSGNELLLKNYGLIAYWNLTSGETLETALKRQLNKYQPFVAEKQGEGICFDADAASYISISEINDGSYVPFNRYWRQK